MCKIVSLQAQKKNNLSAEYYYGDLHLIESVATTTAFGFTLQKTKRREIVNNEWQGFSCGCMVGVVVCKYKTLNEHEHWRKRIAFVKYCI